MADISGMAKGYLGLNRQAQITQTQGLIKKLSIASKNMADPKGIENVLSEVAQVTSNYDVVSKAHIRTRIAVAYQSLSQILEEPAEKGRGIGEALARLVAGDPQLSQSMVAKELAPVLQNPKKFGLEDKDLEKLINAFYHISGNAAFSPNLGLNLDERLSVAQQVLPELGEDKTKASRQPLELKVLKDDLIALSGLPGSQKGKTTALEERAKAIVDRIDNVNNTWEKKSLGIKTFEPKRGNVTETIGSVAGMSGFIKRFSINKLAAALGSAFGGPIGAAIASAVARVLVGTFNAINRFVGIKVGGVQGFLISLALWFATITMVVLVGIFTVLIVPLLVGSFTLIFLLSFIIFVINAGAYVVPPGAGLGNLDFTSSIGNASCPLLNGYVARGSYGGNEEVTNVHGNTYYWQRIVPPADCRFALPQDASECRGPVNSRSVCSDQSNTCPYYGFAADIFSATSSNVYAPSINGENLLWNYTPPGFDNPQGYTHIYTDSTGKYVIYLTHTLDNQANQGSNIPSGTILTQLFPQGTNTHLHLEFQVDGVYQRPEDWFCK